MPEGKKYLESRDLNGLKRPSSVTSNFSIHSKARSESVELIVSNGRELQEQIDAVRAEIDAQSKRARLDVFFQYFSEWRHLRTLIGTASTWFLMDVAFYGTNLNQSVILTDIGFSKGANEYETLKRNAIGNLIIAVAGYVPGYFVTIFFVEKLGRRWIQIQGFLITALMFAVIAGDYTRLGTGGRFVCLAIIQVRVQSFCASLSIHSTTISTHPFVAFVKFRLTPTHHLNDLFIFEINEFPLTILSYSSSSTSVPTQPPSLFPLKSFPRAFAASAMVSPPLQGNLEPSSLRSSSTTCQQVGACPTFCGYILLASSLERSLLGSRSRKRDGRTQMSRITRNGSKRMSLSGEEEFDEVYEIPKSREGNFQDDMILTDITSTSKFHGHLGNTPDWNVS